MTELWGAVAVLGWEQVRDTN